MRLRTSVGLVAAVLGVHACTPEASPGGDAATATASAAASATDAASARAPASATPRSPAMRSGPGGGVVPPDDWVQEYPAANQLFRGLEACAAQERWNYIPPPSQDAGLPVAALAYTLELPAMSPPELEKLFKERVERINPAAFRAGQAEHAVLKAAGITPDVNASRMSYMISVSVPAVSLEEAAERWRHGAFAWLEQLEKAVGSPPTMVTIRYYGTEATPVRMATIQHRGSDGGTERARDWGKSHGFVQDDSKGEVAKLKAQAGFDIWIRKSATSIDMLMLTKHFASATVTSPVPKKQADIEKVSADQTACQRHKDWKETFP